MTDRMIRVWEFDHAPEDLKALSQWGGDEDWIAVVPAGVDAYGGPLGRLLYRSSMGPEEHTHPAYPGCKILIAAH